MQQCNTPSLLRAVLVNTLVALALWLVIVLTIYAVSFW